MSTLMIKDLVVDHELDRASMRTLRGGMFKGHKGLFRHPSSFSSAFTLDFDAEQSILQSQIVETNNGNNVAFAHDIKSVVKPTQNAQNNINLGGLL